MILSAVLSSISALIDCVQINSILMHDVLSHGALIHCAELYRAQDVMSHGVLTYCAQLYGMLSRGVLAYTLP